MFSLSQSKWIPWPCNTFLISQLSIFTLGQVCDKGNIRIDIQIFGRIKLTYWIHVFKYYISGTFFLTQNLAGNLNCCLENMLIVILEALINT